MNVTPQEILNTMFNPADKVCLRVFEDRKKGVFKGQKIEVEAGRFPSVLNQLLEHNKANRGIFYTVNFGGHEDKDITRINAQYVEMDDKSFEEQMALIDAFPLPPSFIIRTRKSLHTYWLVDDKATVDAFRPIQRGLIKHFGGDSSIVNESRVMRLPGFYHCKEEPIMVECISFHPERRYSQEQIAETLGLKDLNSKEGPSIPEGKTRGLALAEAGCKFLKHCRDNAETLPESDWYAMVTNLAVFEGGRVRIHELSAPYPRYSKEETDEKISHFLKSGTRPMTCRTIAEKGFHCPMLDSGECRAKAPAGRCGIPLDVDVLIDLVQDLPTARDLVRDLQTARKFVEAYMYNSDPVTAQTVIKYEMRERFNLRMDDVRPLLNLQKELSRRAASPDLESEQFGDIPPWYEIKKNGVSFKPGVLAAHLKDNEKVFYAAEEFFRYGDGVYSTIPTLEAENTVRKNMLVDHAKLCQITDTTAQWKMQIAKEMKLLNPNAYAINLKNGLYNVLEDTLFEHTPDYLSTIQLNARYTPGAECPRFIQFLKETLPEDQLPLVQEILGYLLVPVNNAQKCFVLVGEGGAGKSVLLRVIEAILGKENVSNVSWQALNERFKPAELHGKLANIFADLPTKNIDDNGIFKALVGEDYLTVEKKHKNPFSFVSHARLLFSCNTIPKNYGDKSEGFYRRLIIIRYDHSIPAEKRDPFLTDRLVAETDGILLFALEGLRRLMGNGWKFSETERNRIELQTYREDSNSALSFLRDCCTEDADSEVPTVEMYTAYKDYCTKSGLLPCSQKTLIQEIRNAKPEVKYGRDKLGKRRTWRGLKLEEYDD